MRVDGGTSGSIVVLAAGRATGTPPFIAVKHCKRRVTKNTDRIVRRLQARLIASVNEYLHTHRLGNWATLI